MSASDNNTNSFDNMYKKYSKWKATTLDNMLSAYLLAEKSGFHKPSLKELSVNTATPMWKIKAKLFLKRLRYITF